MPRESCAVCEHEVASSRICRVVVGGRTVSLCRTHAARVASERPATFEELRRLFVETPSASGADRRSAVDRRRPDDRRVFPPRPEGRRMPGGRRSADRRET
jgi:hypothetical protein